MNFLQLLASGASILNFNFQPKNSQSLESIHTLLDKPSGFTKVSPPDHSKTLNSLPENIAPDQANLLKQILENERQDLINQYLQLNIHLLEGKVSIPQSKPNQFDSENLADEAEDKEQLEAPQKHLNSKKKIKKPVKCGHDDKAHYAKGMCNNCYHKYGRTKKPWNCPHQKLYAAGMCQNCYINMYNKKKRDEIQSPDDKPRNLQNWKPVINPTQQPKEKDSKLLFEKKISHAN